MAANFAQAVAKHVAGGATKIYQRSLEHRNDDRCAVCGCYLAEKAAWRASERPLGKWGVG